MSIFSRHSVSQQTPSATLMGWDSCHIYAHCLTWLWCREVVYVSGDHAYIRQAATYGLGLNVRALTSRVRDRRKLSGRKVRGGVQREASPAAAHVEYLERPGLGRNAGSLAYDAQSFFLGLVKCHPWPGPLQVAPRNSTRSRVNKGATSKAVAVSMPGHMINAPGRSCTSCTSLDTYRRMRQGPRSVVYSPPAFAQQ